MLAPLRDAERRDLIEVVEDRAERASTLIASQLPVTDWHAVIGGPNQADAICDRLLHDAHRIELKAARCDGRTALRRLARGKRGEPSAQRPRERPAGPGLPSRLRRPFPRRYVTAWGSTGGVGERGAAGALPGAAAGWRVPGPVPPAGGPEVAATERRPHEEQPGATRQPGSVRLLRRRRACRLREPQLAESLAGSATGRCSSRSAIWIVVLFEHTAVTAGARVESQVPLANRMGGTDRSTSLRSDERPTSPKSVFHFTEMRVPLHRNPHEGHPGVRQLQHAHARRLLRGVRAGPGSGTGSSPSSSATRRSTGAG